jgi:hypothetical protein
VKKLIVFLILLLVFFLPLVWFALNLWQSKKNLEETRTALLTGDFEKAQILAADSARSFRNFKFILSFLPSAGRISQLKNSVEMAEVFAETGYHLAEAGELTGKIMGIVLGEKVGDLNEIVGETKAELDLAWKKMAFIEASFKENPLPELSQIREKIEIGQELLSILPEVVGFSQKKSYLFLLQNNMELRATGGFIGSYALAIFEDGRLLDFQIEDVYAADGQLKGHVEPPGPIKKYLGEAGWYLRDSNYDPDFPTSAKKVEWFFEKETGRLVDGVIGVNLYLAQKILKAVGPVKLPDYQETINADNLFERAEYHSEVNFFPGSTQKKDFLASLTSRIFQELKLTKEWLKIGEVFFESLVEKQVLISLTDEEAMRVMRRYGWDGRVLENAKCQKEPETGCVADYLMIVESNFSVNKCNYFVERKLTHEIKLEGEIEEKLTINYQNNSPTQTWPGGNYHNYLRVYVPQDSQVLEVKIDEELLEQEKIDVSQAFGKKIIGFLVPVPVGEEKEVSLRYKPPFEAENIDIYTLLVQKQSGTEKSPLTVLIRRPPDLKVVKIAPQALTGPEVVLYNTNLLRDRAFLVEFSR